MAGPTIARAIWMRCCALGRELRRELRLLSPPGRALSGPGWSKRSRRAVEARLGRRVAGILDCADRADLVQAAFRAGHRAVVFHGPRRVADKLADIAAAQGAAAASAPAGARPRRRGGPARPRSGVISPPIENRASLGYDGPRPPLARPSLAVPFKVRRAADEDDPEGQEDPRQLRERQSRHQGQPRPHPDARPARRHRASW